LHAASAPHSTLILVSALCLSLPAAAASTPHHPLPPTANANSYNADLERVVRTRGRRGRHFPIMRVIPPGLDFSNLKISAPPDPWEAANNAGGANNGAAAGFNPAGGSGSLQRKMRRSSASSSWAFLQAASNGNGPASNGPASNGAATDDQLAPAGQAGGWCRGCGIVGKLQLCEAQHTTGDILCGVLSLTQL
jgi:hypothetical protein